MVGVKVTHNAPRIAAALRGHPAVVRRRMGTTVRKWGMTAQTRVKANAKGRPGPRLVTGDYNRSITLEYQASGNKASSTIGTNKAQGRRLEFGFSGADRLGRVYNQPPLPHFGPARESVREPFTDEIRSVMSTFQERQSRDAGGTLRPGGRFT